MNDDNFYLVLAAVVTFSTGSFLGFVGGAMMDEEKPHCVYGKNAG
jgi:hypothetical protein